MPQLTAQDQADLPAFEGGLYDTGPYDIVSRSPGGNVKQQATLTIGASPTAAVAEVQRLTINTAVDGDTLVITIGEFQFTITTVGSDIETQRDAILTLLALNEDFVVLYTAVAQSTNAIDVTANRPGTQFEILVTASGSAVAQIDTLTISTPTTAVKQISRLTITTASNGDAFTIEINGVTVAAGTSSGTDKTVQRDAIEVLLLANAYFNANFDYADQGSDAMDITAKVAGEPFGVEATVTTSAYDWTEPTANVVGTQFKFTLDDYEFQYAAASTGITAERNDLLTLLQADTVFDDDVTFAADSTDKILVTAIVPGTPFTMTYVNESPKGDDGAATDPTFTTTTANAAASTYSWAEQTGNTIGTQFKFIIDGRELLYAAASTGAETERNALLVLLQADTLFATEVDFAALSTDAITITAKTAGDPHAVTFENENGVGDAGTSATITFVAGTANVTGQPIPFGRGLAQQTTVGLAALPSVTGFTFEGISVNRAKARPLDNTVSPPVTGPAVYKGDEAVPVLRRGRIWIKVEDVVTLASGVFVRHTQGPNSLHTVGRFRGADVGAEVDEITQGARWVKGASAEGLAVLEVDVMAVVSA